MQCPECNKFTSPGQVNVDLENVQGNGDMVTGTVNARLECIHCGAEYAQQELTFDLTAACCDHPNLETQDEDAEPYEGELNVGKGKKPKLVPSYGAEIKVGVHCTSCNTFFDLEGRVESPASDYEPI